ncbi:MAG: hypothetical protein EOP48_02770 [Sphingobacteriales bacterium]|nr:MAG: hypothetical protein EOP48_02770 [Sphingobacteriales bacterium]
MPRTNFEPQLPIYDDAGLNFEKLKELMGVNSQEVADMLDVSESTVRSGKISSKTLKNAQPLLHILNMIWKLMDGNAAEIRRWLNEPRIEWSGLSPMTCLSLGKAQAVVNFLESNFESEVSGT